MIFLGIVLCFVQKSNAKSNEILTFNVNYYKNENCLNASYKKDEFNSNCYDFDNYDQCCSSVLIENEKQDNQIINKCYALNSTSYMYQCSIQDNGHYSNRILYISIFIAIGAIFIIFIGILTYKYKITYDFEQKQLMNVNSYNGYSSLDNNDT